MAIYRLTVQLSWPGVGGPGTNTWHYRDADPDLPFSDDVSETLQNFYTSVGGFLTPGMTISLAAQAVSVDQDPPTLVNISNPFSINTGSGSNGGVRSAQACITWRSNVATRSGRGRTFVGPLATGAIDGDGTLTAAAYAQFRQAADELVDASTAGFNGALSIWSTKNQIGRDITSYTMRDRVAVLRSRND